MAIAELVPIKIMSVVLLIVLRAMRLLAEVLLVGALLANVRHSYERGKVESGQEICRLSSVVCRLS